MRFSESSQNFPIEKSIFSQFEVHFLDVKLFSGPVVVFPVSTYEEKCFNEKMSSLASFNKNYSFFPESTNFGHFWLPRSVFKVDFLSVQAKFQEMVVEFPRNV